MKPAPFKLLRPHDLEAVCAALNEYGDAAQLLAGGQSLVPAMNFRVAQPEVLVDLGRVVGLDRIDATNGELVIGAMVRQRSAESHPTIRRDAAMISRALPFVGHLQNRNRGTIGGSIAHADPAGELPAVAMALDGRLRLVSSRGERIVDATDFIEGPLMTAKEPDEVLVEVRIPRRPDAIAAVHEIARRHGDFALAGIAAIIEFSDDRATIRDARLAAFGVTSRAIRLSEVESSLAGSALTRSVIRSASRMASESLDRVADDHFASGSYRREAVGVLTARALIDLATQSPDLRSEHR